MCNIYLFILNKCLNKVIYFWISIFDMLSYFMNLWILNILVDNWLYLDFNMQFEYSL